MANYENSVKDSIYQKKILVIEDDLHIAEGLKLNLSLQGYEVAVANEGQDGLSLWKAWQPDIIVLDLMLPVVDGVTVLRNIRQKDERIPILILSAKGAPDDKVECFSYGVDDYLQKPFNLDEFLMRIERLLVRSSWTDNSNDIPKKPEPSEDVFIFGDNRIDFKNSVAYSGDREIILTEQEVRLMRLFISNKGKPLSRKKLLEIGWGYVGKTETRTIDNFVVRLRKYFERNPKKPEFFKSLRSIGYIFNDDSQTEEPKQGKKK